MRYKIINGPGGRTTNKKMKTFFQRTTLVFLSLVLAFTIAMPSQVMAWNPFDWKPQPKEPSVLPAQKVDVAKTQAVRDTPMNGGSEKSRPKEDRTIVSEDTSKRTEYSSTYNNRDGTKTLRYTMYQQNYKDGTSWKKINNTLESDQKPLDKNLFDMMSNTERKTTPTRFKGKAGKVSAEMKPLSEGLAVTAEGRTITIKPAGARNVLPEQKDERTVVYKDAWPGVNLEYELRGESVKENIILKNKNVRTTYDFTVEGGKVINHPTRKGELAIEGISSDFSFSSLTLDVNERGVISEERVTQTPTDKGLKVEMDKKWFKEQPENAFPMRIDPSYGSYVTSWWMFKSDGYSCGASNCYANIGTLHDGAGWKHWRTYIQFPYQQLDNKKILNANLHGWFQHGANGIGDGRSIWMGHANCVCFNGRGTQVGSAYVGTDFDINFTNHLQHLVNIDHYGAVWSLWGEEGPYKSFKPYVNMYADVYYDTATPLPSPIDPADNQVMVDTQPTLRVSTVGDPDGDQVKYRFRVSTNSDGSGATVTSDWLPTNQWTVPEGVLQDGTTYYWRVDSMGATDTYNNVWKRAFKVDLRTGKDSTQAYDTVGPMGTDLATGNTTTSSGTHSMNALGGSIGLNFEYNSPTKAQKGLTGEYWNVPANYDYGLGAPTSQPNLVRTDPDLNFDWAHGTSPGSGINPDWFYARWKGYLVAPVTGDYSFGALQDDALTININGQTFWGCGVPNPCFNGNTIHLEAGKPVPINVTYEEATGNGYFKMFVKGPVAQQIVPRDWFRSEVKPSVAQFGLTGRYYTNDGTHTFPSDPNDSNRLLMVRNDSKISFDWGSGPLAPGLPSDSFMARWTGYVTVPADGAYTFGKLADDGVRVKLNNGLLGASQTVLDHWGYSPDTIWGSPVNLAQGQQVPITVEYFEATHGANVTLKMKGPGLNAGGEDIPVKWLTPKATALPDSWQVGVDIDGNVGYERLRVAGNNIILEDSSRATHEYTWTGSGYKPPVNEDGQLTRNANNTYTLIDVDGRTYVFDNEGKLTSLTTPTDDRNPANLQYEYSGDPSRLMKITDGVTTSRYGTLHYKGANEDGNCSVPNGFDAAPDGMLCAFKTSDGDITKLYYKSGQLSRIEKPGNERTDYGYDELGRIINVRDSLANDAIAAGVRQDNSEVLTEVSYDTLGRASAVKAPAPTQGAHRVDHTFEYARYGSGNVFEAVGTGVAPATTPKSISWDGTRIDQVARGVGNDLVHRAYINGAWTAWVSLGGCIMDTPAISSWAPGRLDVLVRGCNTSGNNLYHRAYDNGQWYDWGQPPSNFITAAPSIASGAFQRIDYVVKGANNELYHSYWTPGSGWGQQGSLGGCINSPTISSSGYEQLDIYVVGCGANSDNVYYKSHRPLMGWSDYILQKDMIAESVTSMPVAGSGTMLVAKAVDGSMKVRTEGGTWQPVAPCVIDRPTLSAHGNYAKLFYRACGSSDLTQASYAPAVGTTKLRIAGASEPHGFSKRVEYDSLLRTIKETDVTNLSSLTQWDQAKDLELSKTDATGLKSTTIYDDDDKPVENYGPAPAAWYGITRKPLEAHADAVPKTTTAYDEGMTGPAVAWHNAKGSSLVGTPKLVTQGIDQADKSHIGRDFRVGDLGFTPDNSMDGYGFTATGKVRFPASGTYTLRLYHDDGARVSIDDRMVIDNWAHRSEGIAQALSTGTFVAEAGKVYRFKFDYLHVGNPGGLELWWAGPGITDTNNGHGTSRPAFLTPNYNLTTSQTAYDNLQGSVTTKTTYAKPEYGLVDKTILDPTNLNLQTTSTYETPGAPGSFLRQTSKTLPGGGTTTYQHYTASDTRDNPCTTDVEAFRQAGRPKGKIEADPDGSGPETSRTTETVYNESGEVVASRYNNDPWTCTTYDARGRVQQTIIPARGDRTGRTITNDYAKDGNPLITTTEDDAGIIRVENDLLGRTLKYTDVHGKLTTNTYDNFGKLTQRVSPIGTETYEYDQYDRLTKHKLDSVTFATVTYDQYSRLANVNYPAGLSLGNIGRDAIGRENSTTFTLASGQTLTDQIERFTSGDIKQGVENGTAKSYQYDNAGRLVGATIGGNTFAYEFGTPDTSCASQPGNNPNAGKNGNRTKLTINGQNTTYCYDAADRLVSSSDPTLTNAQYDTHGNTISLGDATHKTEFDYDTSDRNRTIKSGDKETVFARDVQGRIVSREQKVNNQVASSVKYSFTGSGDTPDALLDANGDVKQKYLTLPGDVLVTLKTDSQSAGATTYSVPNIHGDIFATVNADGALMSTFATGPFGEVLPTQPAQPQGAVAPSAAPANTASGTAFGYVGQHEKLTDLDTSPISGGAIQMGARVYIPTLGRFLSVDPQEGGNDNNYAYVNDPVNGFDLDGNAGWFDNIRKGVQKAASWAWKNRETIATVASIGMMLVPGLGAAAIAVRVVATAVKIAKVAKAGGDLAKIGKVGKVTSNLAGRIYTGRPIAKIGKSLQSRDGLRQYRPPVYKVHQSKVQSNFERFKVKPVSKNSFRWPNRIYNGHLNGR